MQPPSPPPSTTPLPFAYGKRPEDIHILGRSPLLRSLGVQELARFLDLLDQFALVRGTSILREGEGGDCLYFILEGEARIRRGPLELRTIGPGDHFGELALLGKTKQSVTVEAHTTMRLARLTRSRYLSLSVNHPMLALHLTQALAATTGDQLAAMMDNVGLLAHQRSIPRRMHVRIRRGADDLVVDTGTLAGTLLPREHEGSLVVGATANRKPTTLETALVADAEIAPLTLASLDGRAIYLRSMCLLLLEAARRVAPELPLRMGPPVETGQIVLVPEGVDRPALAASLLRSVEHLVRDDVPLREEIWSTDEARALMIERGDADAAALLLGWRDSTVALATCGETFAVCMGPLVTRAGCLTDLSLVPHPMGLFLRAAGLEQQMPSHRGTRIDPTSAEPSAPRYASEMSVIQRGWLDRLGVTGVGTFDAFCVTGRVPELIRVAEGFHEKWIGRIADAITARRGRVKVIAIAGPSSSGKTTFIKRLIVQLIVDGMRPLAVSLDDYYVDREKTVRDESGAYDFEALEAIDLGLLQGHLARLLAGERVTTARFDFLTGKSLPGGGKELAMSAGDVLLVEGIHGLNPALLGGAVAREQVFGVFVHPATTLSFDRLGVLASEDVRLLRRLVRDRRHRNRSTADTILGWPSVRRGELRHIFPFLPQADTVFDSSLVYELSVIKTYAERYLLEVPPMHPAFTTAYRLRKLIDHFVAIHPDHVPPTSVIREFIGGSGFEY